MNIGRTVFSQLTDFINDYVFISIVDQHNGNNRVRHFTCWEQFLCMLFAQLTISLKVYDVAGHEIAILVEGYKSAGRYNVRFDASNLSS